MTTHARHPGPAEREEFLVDGCARCAEYVAELGLPFDPERFRAFWRKMVEVEFEDRGGYASSADKALGRSLYYVALSFQRAFGIDPALLDEFATLGVGIIAAPGSGRFGAFTTSEREELSFRLLETFTLGDNGIAQRLREEIDR